MPTVRRWFNVAGAPLFHWWSRWPANDFCDTLPCSRLSLPSGTPADAADLPAARTPPHCGRAPMPNGCVAWAGGALRPSPPAPP